MNTKIKLLTIRQSAKIVEGLTEYRIRRLIKAGLLPHLKSGNRFLIDEQAIYEFVANAQNKEVSDHE